MLRIITKDGSVICIEGTQSDICCGRITIEGSVTIESVNSPANPVLDRQKPFTDLTDLNG